MDKRTLTRREIPRAEQSAVAEYVNNRGYEIHFDKVKILNKETHFGRQMFKKIIEIKKCQGN